MMTFSRADTFGDKREGITNDLLQLIAKLEHERDNYNDGNPYHPYLGVNNPNEGFKLYSLIQERDKFINVLRNEQRNTLYYVGLHHNMNLWLCGTYILKTSVL
jgi:hypothetical protein